MPCFSVLGFSHGLAFRAVMSFEVWWKQRMQPFTHEMVEGTAFSLVKGCCSYFQSWWNPFSQSYGPLKHLGNGMFHLGSLRPDLLFLGVWGRRADAGGEVAWTQFLFRVPKRILLCRGNRCTSVWWHAELDGYFFRNTEGLAQLVLGLGQLGPAVTLAVKNGGVRVQWEQGTAWRE